MMGRVIYLSSLDVNAIQIDPLPVSMFSYPVTFTSMGRKIKKDMLDI